ncbi:MAG: SDR family NAD(P)-dependent oxidoreductase [Clostridium sp.]|uniref:SDR family NAD(P)-dependent oxidoreductase n=1 Tax=Clostridium sp. TaxID=1506 RepID=UPI0030394018
MIVLKNVIITGGTRGIGLSMAREFLKSGCNVTVCGRTEESLIKCEEELIEHKGRVQFLICDVMDKFQIERIWFQAKDRWRNIDIWINNAGKNCSYELLWNTEDRFVEQVIDTNIKGVIYGSKIAAKYMIEQGDGQIWNMEGLGSDGRMIEKTILYGTSKRAVTYFTKALAKELADTSVKIGRLSPGMMLTDFITKSPDGSDSKAIEEESFKKIFNILGDKPETVAKFFVPRMLKNGKNNAHIQWLTTFKVTRRFITAKFSKNKRVLIE